jgi:hypothetical protein
LTGGPGSDGFSAEAGDTINAKDGQRTDFIGCERPAKHVSYDAATTLDPDDHPNDQVEVAECLGHDTGSKRDASQSVTAELHPDPDDAHAARADGLSAVGDVRMLWRTGRF